MVGAAGGGVVDDIAGDAGMGAAGGATATPGAGNMRADEPGPGFVEFGGPGLREKGYQPPWWL
jgi:hypothetical protein